MVNAPKVVPESRNLELEHSVICRTIIWERVAMDAVKLDEDTGKGGRAADQSRREALKRFGRYAAAAPATMVLLQPRDGSAARRGGGGGNGRGGGDGPY